MEFLIVTISFLGFFIALYCDHIASNSRTVLTKKVATCFSLLGQLTTMTGVAALLVYGLGWK